MKYGYARVSTDGQSVDAQVRQLTCLAIALTVFGFSLFGDSLRDALDPKLRDR